MSSETRCRFTHARTDMSRNLSHRIPFVYFVCFVVNNPGDSVLPATRPPAQRHSTGTLKTCRMSVRDSCWKRLGIVVIWQVQ